MRILNHNVKIEKKKASTLAVAGIACIATVLFLIAYFYIAREGVVEHRRSDENVSRRYHEVTLLHAETVPVKTGAQAKSILFFSFMLIFLCVWKASHDLTITKVAKDKDALKAH